MGSRMASLLVESREAAGAENLLLRDREIDERGKLPASSAVDESDEVAEQWGVRPLPALVGRDAGEFEELVDFRLREVERGHVLAASRGQPIARVSQPVVHSRSLVSARHE